MLYGMDAAVEIPAMLFHKLGEVFRKLDPEGFGLKDELRHRQGMLADLLIGALPESLVTGNLLGDLNITKTYNYAVTGLHGFCVNHVSDMDVRSHL